MTLKSGVHALSRALLHPQGPFEKAEKKGAVLGGSARAADIVTASLLMALGGIVLVGSIRLGFRWGTDGPESGFFPFWLATILIFACAVIIVQAARQRSEKPFVEREQFDRVLTVLWPAAGMVLLTQFAGLYVTSALYMGFYMRWKGRHTWSFSIALPVLVSVMNFFLFEKWFLVPLPKGPLEAWLGY